MDLLRSIIIRLGEINTTHIERGELVAAGLRILESNAVPPDPEPESALDPEGTEPGDDPIPELPKKRKAKK